MSKALDRVVDAVDIETFLYCTSEEEAKELAEALALQKALERRWHITFHEDWPYGRRVIKAGEGCGTACI